MNERYKAIRLGQCVRVLTAYRGGGRFEVDGFEGLWYVVGFLEPLDFKLAKHPDDEWEVIVHASRVAETSDNAFDRSDRVWL